MGIFCSTEEETDKELAIYPIRRNLYISDLPHATDLWAIQSKNINYVVSVLTEQEIRENTLDWYENVIKSNGLGLITFPINKDRMMESMGSLNNLAHVIYNLLNVGYNILVHGLDNDIRPVIVAGCILTITGLSRQNIVEIIRIARPGSFVQQYELEVMAEFSERYL